MSLNKIDSTDLKLSWLLNISASLFVAASHNALYYVLSLRTPVFHFMHYFFTFCFFVLVNKVKKLNQFDADTLLNKSALKRILPLSCFQLVLSILSSLIHSGQRSGSLYILRLTDFLTTIIILKYWTLFQSPKKTKGNNKVNGVSTQDWLTLVPLAVFGSMAWLEFGNLEYDSWSFFLAPIHAILNGLYYLYAQSVFNQALKKEKNMCFDRFCLINTFLTSTLLLFPAIVSVASSQISYDASWESIDYTLVGLSFIYMIGMKYSDFTLSFRVDLRYFSILEHSKYFLASMGQWYLQNMAHATVYAFVSKILFVLSVIRFYLTIDLSENLEPSICKAVKYSDIKDKEICE